MAQSRSRSKTTRARNRRTSASQGGQQPIMENQQQQLPEGGSEASSQAGVNTASGETGTGGTPQTTKRRTRTRTGNAANTRGVNQGRSRSRSKASNAGVSMAGAGALEPLIEHGVPFVQAFIKKGGNIQSARAECIRATTAMFNGLWNSQGYNQG